MSSQSYRESHALEHNCRLDVAHAECILTCSCHEKAISATNTRAHDVRVGIDPTAHSYCILLVRGLHYTRLM